jgi:hypothetical protein
MIGELALVFAALFAGAAVFVTVAEQPARLALADEAMLLEWQRSYSKAAPMQGALALGSGALGLLMAWQTKDPRWIAGAVLILTNWPFTLLVIKPVNDRLHATPRDRITSETRGLVVRWGALHSWRSALGLLAVAAYWWAMH